MSVSTFARTRRALASGQTTCRQIAEHFLGAIADNNPDLNAFTYVDDAGTLKRADELDAALARGEKLPLAGLVLGVKDVLCIRDWPVTCSSRILKGHRPRFDATAVARLRAAGALFIGRTNCDEFAMGSTNESSYYGPVHNPVRKGWVPGGSSGGSAAAVAAELCHGALGTDTGGSVRQPAAFCGVVGLKPTYGRVSRNGLIAYASSFDCVGVFTQCVADAAAMLDVMSGADERDATSASEPAPQCLEALPGSMQGMRFGLPEEYYADGLDAEVQAAIMHVAQQLEEAGAEVLPVRMPHTDFGIATYYILAAAEASSNLARYDGVRYGERVGADTVTSMYTATRSQGFGFEVKRRIMLGTYVLSAGYYEAYYGKAQRVRALVRDDFDAAFRHVDLLLTPVSPVAGARLGEWGDDPLKMYLSDIYTVTANLAGVPGLSVPIGMHSTGLPIGAQLLGRPFDEKTLLRAGDGMMELAGTTH